MKKNLLSILALALAAAALLAALAGQASAGKALQERTEALEAQNAQLAARLEELEQSLQRLQTVTSLESWSLEAAAWSDASGADITFTAVPTEYTQGISATLLVRLGTQQVAAVPCSWDGNAFTAVAGLNLEDGYSYYCLLQSPGGTEQLLLASPETPAEETAVFLKSAMLSYCNLVVSEWTEKEGKLVLTDAYAHAQLPRLSPHGQVTLRGAELELVLNGAVTEVIPITMATNEVDGSFEMSITNAEFTLPALTAEDVLELQLRIKPSAGEDLVSYGASWYLEGETLTSVVG